MPHFTSFDAWVELDDIDLGGDVISVSWDEDTGEREQTGLHDTHRRFTGDMPSGTVTIEWLANYHTGGVYRTLEPLYGKRARLRVRPHGPVESADNPTYSADVLVSRLPRVSAAIGELSTFRTTLRLSGPTTTTPEAIWRAEMVVGQQGVGVRGFRDRASIEFGSLTPTVVPADVIPGHSSDVTITQITWNGTTELRVYFVNATQADAMHGLYLVANPLSMHLDPSPGTDEWYASTSFPDGTSYPQPGWGTGNRVRIELWNANPDVHSP